MRHVLRVLFVLGTSAAAVHVLLLALLGFGRFDASDDI